MLVSSVSSVGLFPSEGWNVLVLKLGLKDDIFEPEVEVPLRVSNLEVLAISVKIAHVAPLILVFPSRKLKPFLSSLFAENSNQFIVSVVILPGKVKDASSGITVEVSTVNLDMLSDWVFRNHGSIFPPLKLPVGIIKLNETPVIFSFSLCDSHFVDVSPWA